MTAIRITTLGDSQTDLSASTGVDGTDMWTYRLARLCGIAATAAHADRERSFGVSGNTSQQLIDRLDVAFQYSEPTIAGAAIGVNDTSFTAAQEQTNIQTILMALKHRAVGLAAGMGAGVTAATQAALPVLPPGSRLVVLADGSTTGGVDPTGLSAATRIAGAVAADSGGNKITVWESVLPLAGAAGWCRVATRTTAPTSGPAHIFVVTPPYRNWANGTGDTPATPYAQNALIRTGLAAAVTAENVAVGGAPSVILVDTWTWMRQRILDGKDPNFTPDTSLVATTAYDQTRSWHYITNDQHFNEYGHMLQAAKVYTDIKAAWPTLGL